MFRSNQIGASQGGHAGEVFFSAPPHLSTPWSTPRRTRWGGLSLHSPIRYAPMSLLTNKMTMRSSDLVFLSTPAALAVSISCCVQAAAKTPIRSLAALCCAGLHRLGCHGGRYPTSGSSLLLCSELPHTMAGHTYGFRVLGHETTVRRGAPLPLERPRNPKAPAHVSDAALLHQHLVAEDMCCCDMCCIITRKNGSSCVHHASTSGGEKFRTHMYINLVKKVERVLLM